LVFVLALPVCAQEAQAKPQRDVAELYQAAVAGNSQALQQLRTLATEGEGAAQYNLGLIYENGPGVPRDYAEAVRWYRKAADQGLANAQYNLGYIYASGQGVPQDYGEAMRWYRKAADQGVASAQYNLGYMYANRQVCLRTTSKRPAGFEGADQGSRARSTVSVRYTLGAACHRTLFARICGSTWQRQGYG
jgi:TPR repeat protein